MNVLDQVEAPARSRPLELPRDVGERAGRLLGVVAVGVIVGAGVILAVDSSQHFSSVVANSWRHFPSWERGPFQFLPGSLLASGLYSELTFLMLFAYLVAVVCSRWLGVRLVVGAIVLLHLVFLLTPPLASTDIWNYIGYSHLGVLHGLSPYSHTPIAARHDPAFQFVTWPQLKTPYGP